MDGFSISVLVAFIGGALSFLSPCVLPLVPGYICFAAGVSYDELHETPLVRRIIPATLTFIAGFSLVFILLGAGAAAINPFILEYKEDLAKIAGIIIVILGVHMTGILPLRFLLIEKRALHHIGTDKKNIGIAFLLGLAFAFGWTPCIGPILASILVLAAGRESLSEGVILLTAYSFGLGLPFFLTALATGKLALTSLFTRYAHRIEQSAGVLLIVTGIFIFSGTLQNFGTFLIDHFPILARLG